MSAKKKDTEVSTETKEVKESKSKTKKEKRVISPETKTIIPKLPLGYSVGENKPFYMLPVKITMESEMLGSNPNNKETWTEWIAKNAPDFVSPETISRRAEAVGRARYDNVATEDETAADDLEDKITVYARDEEGNPVVFANVLNGFFKNACRSLREVAGTVSKDQTSYQHKLNDMVFVTPDIIPLYGFNKDDMTLLQRPLRIDDRGQNRVALSCSEVIPKGMYFYCVINCLDEYMVDLVLELLDFGHYEGLGQWRNSGKGRFVWELFDEDGNVIAGNKEKVDAHNHQVDDLISIMKKTA